MAITSGCKDKKSKEQKNPFVTIKSPNNAVNIGDTVEVIVSYSDESGLKNTEVRLSNTSTGADVYDIILRDLEGTWDEIRYSVKVPTGINIQGTNTINVICSDLDGNMTEVNQSFEVGDLRAPFVKVINFDSVNVFNANTGPVIITYEMQDAGGIAEISAKLWETGPSGDLINVRDEVTEQISGAPTTLLTKSISLTNTWQGLLNYSVVLKVTDVSGNVSYSPRPFYVK